MIFSKIPTKMMEFGYYWENLPQVSDRASKRAYKRAQRPTDTGMHVYLIFSTVCLRIGRHCRNADVDHHRVGIRPTAPPQRWLDRFSFYSFLLSLSSLRHTHGHGTVTNNGTNNKKDSVIWFCLLLVRFTENHRTINFLDVIISTDRLQHALPLCISEFLFHTFQLLRRCSMCQKGSWADLYGYRESRACDWYMILCCFFIRLEKCVHQYYHTNRYYRIINTLFYVYFGFLLLLLWLLLLLLYRCDRDDSYVWIMCIWKRFSIHAFFAVVVVRQMEKKIGSSLCICFGWSVVLFVRSFWAKQMIWT